MGIEAAMLIDANGEIYLTKRFNKRGEFLEKNLKIHEVD
jgi:hypothetical protein